MRRGEDIADRLLRFGAGTLAVVATLPQSKESNHVAGQLIRSCTSAGANYEEARGAQSRKQFVHKVRTVDQEMRESRYWLRLIGVRWDDLAREVEPLVTESDELVAILTASIKTALGRSEGGM